jgi:hypothetical protein
MNFEWRFQFHSWFLGGKSSYCTNHPCSCVRCHFAVTLLLKLTWLCNWYRWWCTNMSDKPVHIDERSVILKYIVMGRKQLGIFGYHWIKWQRKPQRWQVSLTLVIITRISAVWYDTVWHSCFTVHAFIYDDQDIWYSAREAFNASKEHVEILWTGN